MEENEELEIPEEDKLDRNELFLNNLNSTLFVKRDYELKDLDYEWLDMIEETLPYLDNILRNPKRFIINEEEVVKIEQSKKVTVESVIHLTQHTNFIQKIEDNGDVKPSKLLNINHEESLDTYENRFIYTLLNNMRTFYNTRKEEAGGESFCLDKNNMTYTANTKVSTEDIKISVDISDVSKVIKESSGAKGELSLQDRFNKVKIQMDGFFQSELYQNLNRLHVPPVRSPIRHTNVILKNPNFKKAEELWNYIQSFVSKDKNEKDKRNFYDNGLLKNEYDQAFLMTYIANKNLIATTSTATEATIMREMMTRLIDNLLDTDGELTEDKIKEMFVKQCNNIKESNIRKSISIKNIFTDRLERERKSINDIMDSFEKELV